MSGIALLLDLLRKNNPTFSTTKSLHSTGLFSASIAASTAAASFAASTPFASRFLFSGGGIPVVYADASAVEWTEDYISSLRSAAGKFKRDSIKYSTKEYPLELKPLLSAFGLRSFTITTLRSFLLNYLPLLEPRDAIEEDDEDFLQDTPNEDPTDLVVPFKHSIRQIVREVSVVTTRRVMERLAVHYVSQRMAWKLLKDVPKSARRKAARGMPSIVFCCSVSRTTFRGHLLGVAATWFVQVGIDLYRVFSFLTNNKEEADKLGRAGKIRLVAKRVSNSTVKCGASLVFASIGAGVCATLFHPSTGQWIGCALGDVVGPLIITLIFDRVLHLEI